MAHHAQPHLARFHQLLYWHYLCVAERLVPVSVSCNISCMEVILTLGSVVPSLQKRMCPST